MFYVFIGVRTNTSVSDTCEVLVPKITFSTSTFFLCAKRSINCLFALFASTKFSVYVVDCCCWECVILITCYYCGSVGSGDGGGF